MLTSENGADAAIYHLFFWLGFPFGMLALDCFMFLEPFGLLSVMPMPERMRQFIPACALALVSPPPQIH